MLWSFYVCEVHGYGLYVSLQSINTKSRAIKTSGNSALAFLEWLNKVMILRQLLSILLAIWTNHIQKFKGRSMLKSIKFSAVWIEWTELIERDDLFSKVIMKEIVPRKIFNKWLISTMSSKYVFDRQWSSKYLFSIEQKDNDLLYWKKKWFSRYYFVVSHLMQYKRFWSIAFSSWSYSSTLQSHSNDDSTSLMASMRLKQFWTRNSFFLFK